VLFVYGLLLVRGETVEEDVVLFVYGLLEVLLVIGETIEEVLFVNGLLLVSGETVEEVVPLTGADEVAVVIGALDVLLHPPLPRKVSVSQLRDIKSEMLT
jgi:hypothetical protein